MLESRLKTICVIIGLFLLISIAVPAITADAVDEEDREAKNGRNFKGVYKGKPDKPGKPGGGGGGGGGGKPERPPAVDKWAVVIGIADYKGVGNDLQYTDDDAVDMYNYLISRGYPEDNIRLLLNSKASSRNILKAIDWMNGKETKAASECVFFYSGHGSTYDGYNDGDAEYTDETIVGADLTVILDGQLRARFSSYASQKLTFIFDSCYSGGMDDLAGPGRVVVAASAEEQLSWDGSAQMENGVFSYYFLEGLANFNTVEGAFAYAVTPAHDFVLNAYNEIMDPVMTDQFDGDWAF